MDLAGQHVATYGRLLEITWSDLERALSERGGRVSRDLTRGSDLMVVGRGATNLIANGRLGERLQAAAARRLPVVAEARFVRLLEGRPDAATTVNVSDITPRPPDNLVALLAAFDLIVLEDGETRFSDASVLRTASNLARDGHGPTELIRTLLDARSFAPPGRHRLVTGEAGDVWLQWDDVVTALDGQGLLDLDEPSRLDDAFEAAMIAETEGRDDAAERLYALCTRMDRKDPIAPFNLANVLTRLNRPVEAIHRYGQAIARDRHFAEAFYNRSRCHEARGDAGAAEADLRDALALDGAYPDALFNLGQLRLKAGEKPEAKALFNRFLATDPEEPWADLARKARALAR